MKMFHYFIKSCFYLSFDIGKHVWEPRRKMPKAVSGYAAIEFDGKIYVTGGSDGTNYSHQFYCYDPNANLWFEKSYINGDRQNPAFGKTHQNLYAFGSNKTVHQYDIARDIWTMVCRQFSRMVLYLYFSGI